MRLFGAGGRWQPERALVAEHIAAEPPLSLALTGRPSWRNAAFDASTPAQLLAAYRRHGEGFLSDLGGAFALAITDAQAGSTLLAVDRMGIERLAYAVRGGGIVFSDSAEAVAQDPAIGADLNLQSVFDYLLLHMVPAPATIFAGVQKLPAANCARYARGALEVARYWNPAFASRAHCSETQLAERLRHNLRDGVAACGPDARTGAFLSGGLDSSTVTGLLGAVTAAPPRTFSIGFGVAEFDELRYADFANRHFGAIGHRYHVTAEDIVETFPRIAIAYDEPFGNSSAVPTYHCARLAREHGVTHLLAGDGGDELFAGNERYLRQRVFESYGRIPEVLRRRLLEPVARRINADSPVLPLRKFRSYVDQARIPMPERLESWNYMYREDLGAMLEPGFRAAIDPRAPLRRMAEVYAEAPSDQLLQRMLYFDWQYTLSDNDLRKVGTMCELAGVRVSYPMLDHRVVDLSLEVPPAMQLRGSELRTFFKRAMRDFLPGEIIAKRKHGFGLPFGVWLKSHARLRELILGYLGGLKARRIVRAEFIDRLVALHRDGHAGYYGYAIWDLAMLEAWLQAHPQVTRAPAGAA